MEQPKRRLSAVWFADIVGYTELSNRDEPSALQLVRALQAQARISVGEQDGRVVKHIGDAVLAEFVSTESAVRAAVALQERYIADAEALGLPSTLRIGVHLGEVTATDDGDLYGDGINTAARLQHQASPGQVIISEDVWRQLRQRPEFRFNALGNIELRGISTSVGVYDVLFGAKAALSREPVAVLQVAPTPPPAPTPTPQPLDPPLPRASARSGSRSLLIGGVALLAVVAVGGAVAVKAGIFQLGSGAAPLTSDTVAADSVATPRDSVAAPRPASRQPAAAREPAQAPPVPVAAGDSGTSGSPAAPAGEASRAGAAAPALIPEEMARMRTMITRFLADMSATPERAPDARRFYPSLPVSQVRAFQQMKQNGGAGSQFGLGAIQMVSVGPDTVAVQIRVVVTSPSRGSATFPFDARFVRRGADWIIAEMHRGTGRPGD